jgi:hypothetical protein
MARQVDSKTGIAILLVLALLVAIIFWQLPRLELRDTRAPARATAAVEPGRRPGTGTGDVKPGLETAAEAAEGEAAVAASAETEVALEPADLDVFTAADLAPENMFVRVDLGNYSIDKGGDMDVRLALTAPGLESLAIVLEYDPNLLAFVEGSAEPVGNTFRRGIEFHANPARGKLVLMHDGVPGAKNTQLVSGEVVARFTMRALEAGTTQLLPAGNGYSFTNGRGVDIQDCRISGGRIEIR